MNNYDKIMEIVKKNKGYITTKEVVKNNINRCFLTKLVKKDILIRLDRGYYGLNNYIEDIYFKIQLKSKNVRFSNVTALYLHDLVNRVPLVFNVTLPSGYSGSLQKEKDVCINYTKKEILDLGVEEIYSPFGMKIKVYNMERTICDIIKNKIDSELFTEALKNYAKRKDKNLNRLMEYAKKMNIVKKIRTYIEVLI